MDHRARLRKLAAGAMQTVVDGEKVPRRQLIMPLYGQGFVFAGFDQRSYGLRTVTPQLRRCKIAMHFYSNLAHGDVEQRGVPRSPVAYGGQRLWKKYGSTKGSSWSALMARFLAEETEAES